MKKILFFWKELGTTFWFVPVLIIGFSILLAICSVYLDSLISISREGLVRFFLVESSDSARSILSTISSAMMGVAGTVFSITLVVLTLASSQFGPRLIKNFMYVRLNQVVLGLYISTYLYCLLVLNSIRDSNGDIFIPSISILVAIIAAVINIILLIIFIHQIAISIQADKVVSDISESTFKQVEKLFPEKMGEEKVNEENVNASAVIIRLMEALTTIHEFTSKERHKKAVVRHAEMVLSSGKKHMVEKNDIDDLTERAVKILNN